ncbi:MAG: hypothetical protein ABSA92_12175 [Candidatus Bathyarchaeia archaeon]|jgi:hypothetical protein
MSSQDSEEFKKFKINVDRSDALTPLEPNPFSKLLEVFPKARLISEWRKSHPQVFARARYNNGFVSAPIEGLRIDDGEITVLLYENGNCFVGGPRRVLNILNTIAEYAKKLQACNLYSKELFASKFVQIEGTAKMPTGLLSPIDLDQAVGYLQDASLNRVEAPFLVYNMKQWMCNFQNYFTSIYCNSIQESRVTRGHQSW